MISASAGIICTISTTARKRLATAESEAGEGDGGKEGDEQGDDDRDAVTIRLFLTAVQK